MDFKTKFNDWLSSGLEVEIPSSVKAFSFNLFEPAIEDGVKFGIELIGAASFNSEDDDWACDEVWSPSQRRLLIPIEYSGDNWEECLEKMKAVTTSYLEASSTGAEKLKSRKGVGNGFVDGNLEIILQT